MIKKFLVIILLFSFFSCSSYRPILDQNQQYLSTPKEESDKKIDQCLKDGDLYLKQYKKRRMAKEAGRKAVIGGVIGGVSSVLFGRNLKSVLLGGAVGAGIGAGIGALSVAGEDKVSPDQIKQRYVINCLARDGYGVIGWE